MRMWAWPICPGRLGFGRADIFEVCLAAELQGTGAPGTQFQKENYVSTTEIPSIHKGSAYIEPILWPWPAEETNPNSRRGNRWWISCTWSRRKGRFLIQVAEATPDGLRIIHDAGFVHSGNGASYNSEMSVGWDDSGVTIRLNGEWMSQLTAAMKIPEPYQNSRA